MATTEHTINDALAEVLRLTRRSWRTSSIVSSENTGTLKGSNKRPDILITEPSVSPVVVETEVVPAATVEADAVSRLGEQVRTTGRMILSSIAVRLPAANRQYIVEPGSYFVRHFMTPLNVCGNRQQPRG